MLKSMKLPRTRVLGAALVTIVAVVGFAGRGGSAEPSPSLVATNDVVTTSRPACTDLGDGEVWFSDLEPVTCDVMPPQVLSLTDVPDEATCLAYGGEWYGGGVCYDVDY